MPKLDASANGEVINDIRCDGEVVDLDSLTLDPDNARLHPDRNIEAIKDSLRRYGQREAIVVRSQNRMIAAGNGRVRAMREMLWTRVAASIRPMTDAEFHGYALADNRTAELARWDLEVQARVMQLLADLGEDAVGWTTEEIRGLRAGTVPPGDFPEVDESLEVDHVCPKCGFKFSGGVVAAREGRCPN